MNHEGRTREEILHLWIRKENDAPQMSLETVETLGVDAGSGGIWKYSSRLGAVGEQLEARQDAKYGVSFNPGTLDEAAHQALRG